MHSLRGALEISGATDTGRVREHNEDAVFYDAELGVVVLADGMGGYNAGEVASGLTIDVISETLRAELDALRPQARANKGSSLPVALEMLRIAIDRANSVVFERAATDVLCYGMGTTVVCGLFYDNQLVVGHVGDSRLYRYREQTLARITHDHSLLQEQLDAGLIDSESARNASYRNLVTRAVGIAHDVQSEIQQCEVQVGDLYLFCSDGLTDMLPDDLIAEVLGLFADNLPLAVQTLIEQANANGGRDNVSVVLVGIRHGYAAGRGWFARLASR